MEFFHLDEEFQLKHNNIVDYKNKSIQNYENIEPNFMNEFKTALEEERITIYYQPIVNHTGQIQLAEALLRWNDPEQGMISPKRFIPLVEMFGLIDDLTKWLIVKTCEQLKKWMTSGKAVCPISINLSPKTLESPSFVPFVEDQLNKFSISPRLLEFELTETSLLSAKKNVLTSLNQLKSLGIKITLDDFGTNSTSFEYLRNFEVNKLKIDPIFISGLECDNHKDKTIVSSMIYLGKGLDLDIVAEGVEKYEQFHFLKQQECSLMQGYLFSEPIPVEDFESFLKRGAIIPGKTASIKPSQEQRKYFRFEFTNSVHGKMTIVAVNNSNVHLGTADVLIKDISLGGVKIQSSLSLPVMPNFRFRILLTLMNETFDLEGKIRWKNNEKSKHIFIWLSIYA